MDLNEKSIWLRLQNVCGLTAEQKRGIVAQLRHLPFPDATSLSEAGLNSVQQGVFNAMSEQELERSLHWLTHPDHHLLTWGSPAYPPQLASISSPPALLFVRGKLPVLTLPQLAVVGSRHPSVYGRQWGMVFSQALSLSGLTLTSGLASGIDGIAHQAALEVGNTTVAVLGNGLLHCYPKRHRDLAEAIVEKGGALVSEFAPGDPPLSWHFPRRNRIISGLSLGVLVVEATLRSGSLITARLALEQNRDVFALPGALGSSGSEGTHWLIQQGALLVAHPNNITEQLHSGLHWLPAVPETALFSAGDTHPALPFADVLANVGDEVTSVDVVAERAGQPVPAIVAKLLELELAGWIAAVPGGYVRLRRASHVRRINVLI